MKTPSADLQRAIVVGMKSADNRGLLKPYDVAVSIIIAIEEAGFKIIVAPKPRVKMTAEQKQKARSDREFAKRAKRLGMALDTPNSEVVLNRMRTEDTSSTPDILAELTRSKRKE